MDFEYLVCGIYSDFDIFFTLTILLSMSALIVIVTVISLATYAGWALWRYPLLINQSADEGRGFIQKQIGYQTSFLLLAVGVAILAHSLTAQESWQVFGIGILASPIQAEPFVFPHLDGISWLQFGSLLTLGFGLATLVLVSTSLRSIVNWPNFLRKFGLWIIVLSAVNSLSEELIYRGALIAVAQGLLEPSQIALLSGILFALAHIRGQASGITVVAGSAVVGWCLAHAVLQTHGLFWAWCAHFVQDIIIFLAFIAAMTSAPQSGAPVS